MKYLEGSNSLREKSRMVVGRDWEGEAGRGIEVTVKWPQFCKMKRFLWMDDGKQHNDVNVLNTPELYT